MLLLLGTPIQVGSGRLSVKLYYFLLTPHTRNQRRWSRQSASRRSRNACVGVVVSHGTHLIILAPTIVDDSTMSSLHSCHWDWCRFTTVLHEDFVRHVISAHIDKAEPVKRDDISLIRQVEQGASVHSGESRLWPHQSS